MYLFTSGARLLASSLILTLMLVTSARAEEYWTLAKSQKFMLEILAEGGKAWCAPQLKLRAALKPESPARSDAQLLVGILNRLKAPIENDCRSAVTAVLDVVAEGQRVGTYQATAANGWTFAAVPSEAKSPAPAAIAHNEGAPATAPPAVSPEPTPPAGKTATAPADTDLKAAQPEIGQGYAGVLAHFVRANPAYAEDPHVIRWWAGHRFNNEFRRAANQEFQLAPLLDKARSDLRACLTAWDKDRMVLLVQGEMGAYNFEKQEFPVTFFAWRNDAVHLTLPWHNTESSASLPRVFTIRGDALNDLARIPLQKDSAQAFLQQRTRYGSVDRSIQAKVYLDVRQVQFSNEEDSDSVIIVDAAKVHRIEFFPDKKSENPFATLETLAIETRRAEKAAEKEAHEKARLAQLEEQKLQQLLEQKEHFMQMLSHESESVRFSNFISDDTELFRQPLHSLRSARAHALLANKPTPVRMLVQADGSGTANVATNWPGLLLVSVPEGHPGLERSKWYLLAGTLSVPQGDDLPPALLRADRVYQCEQPECKEAGDPATIVERKLRLAAASQGAN